MPLRNVGKGSCFLPVPHNISKQPRRAVHFPIIMVIILSIFLIHMTHADDHRNAITFRTYLSSSIPSFDSQTFSVGSPPKPKHLRVRQAANHDVNTILMRARFDELRCHFGTFHNLAINRYDLVPNVQRSVEVRSGSLVPPSDSVDSNRPVSDRCLPKRRRLTVTKVCY